MRTVMFWGGLVATFIGLLWMAQGSGVFPYPASSFMINQTPWIVYGACLSAAGLLAVFLSRRRRPPLALRR